MTKHVLLAVCGVVGLSLMSFFYFQSRSHLAQNHHAALDQLTELRQAEISLEKDILRSHNKLTLDYDTISINSEKLRVICGTFS